MPKGAGPSVLVAENNPVARAMMCSFLETLGVFPDSAAHGREALDACRMRDYDLVFLECRMPVMDGSAVVGEIRAWEAGKGKRAYIVGMAERAGEDGAGHPQGMDALLIKPLSLDAVRESLRRAIGDRPNPRPA